MLYLALNMDPSEGPVSGGCVVQWEHLVLSHLMFAIWREGMWLKAQESIVQ